MTDSYVSKRSPRAWQNECLLMMQGRRAFAVLAGMRTGKTKVVVDDWGRMVHDGEALDLVVAAPGGAYLPWADALLADLPPEIASNLMIFIWQSRTSRNKETLKKLKFFMDHQGPRALIINVEALSSVLSARQLVWDFVSRRARQCCVVVDESVTIKNPDSKCGYFLAESIGPKVTYKRIMSGLVSPRSPSDLYNQFRFLDPKILEYSEFTTFQARYERVNQVCMVPQNVLRAKFLGLLGDVKTMTHSQLQWRAKQLNSELDPSKVPLRDLREWLTSYSEGLPRDKMVEAIKRMGGWVQSVPVVEGFQNMDELREKIEPHSFRVRLEDCYDMPPVDYSFRDVEMHPEQERIYREIKANACAQLESLDHVTATHVVVQMLRLHQVLCGHVVDEEGRLHDLPERRTAALVDLLEDYEGKAIVWVSYDRSVEKVVSALEKKFGAGTVSRFWGGNVKTREAEEVRFKTDLSCRFMVATPDAGGRGRDWSAADLVVYFSNRNNLDHRQQSEDRAKAVGKTRPIVYVDMRVKGTVEDRILECLREKIDMSSVINGDSWREWLV